MNVSIYGLGYVGCVSAACLARDGHIVIGTDVNPHKVEQLKAGLTPIIEPGLQELITAGVSSGNLQVTSDSAAAVLQSDISLICVGTPSSANGNLGLNYATNVCRDIGDALAVKPDYHVVVIRSTVLPGTVASVLIPILEAHSGKQAGVDFGVCMNPEFLRESSAIQDFYNPSFIVVGEIDPRSGEAVVELYHAVNAPVIRTDIRTAEMVKYVCNAFHALKVTFANEIGNVCKAQGIDGQRVMEIACMDTQLNISPVYLKPGFAFGGSCLPKDMRALLYRAKEKDLDVPVLNAILPSNRQQIQHGLEMIEKTGRKKVGILGLSFKAGSDDVRESPTVLLVESLVGKGYQVQIYDDTVDMVKLIGSNKSYLEQELPHISQLLHHSLQEVVQEAEVIVIANGGRSFNQVTSWMRPDQVLIDLVGVAKGKPDFKGVYDGICW